MTGLPGCLLPPEPNLAPRSGARLAVLVVLSWTLGMAPGRVSAAEAPDATAPAPRDASTEIEAIVAGQELDLDTLLKPIPPRQPDEALATFEVAAGFELALVAHEPAVVDPVAGAFDAEGRLYVAEMRDYPFRPGEGQMPQGTVRRLEDTDGDGRFDRSTVFAEGLLWPTGIAPWYQGVLVAAAPHIWFFRDTDGDGRADQRLVVFSGFGTQNEQGSVNNLSWGLDGRIYGSASVNGGDVREGNPSEGSALSVRGRDFCFDPWHVPALASLAGARPLPAVSWAVSPEPGMPAGIEAISGNSQFGLAWDDWGNRFLCDESDPSQHVVLPLRYLRRNLDARYPGATHDLNPGVTPIFRLSPLEGWRVVRSSRRLATRERSAQSAGASHDVIDGAAGPVIVRVDQVPADAVGQLWVGDAQNNLVHRMRLVPEGVSFRAERVDQQTELIRSRDNWFRPVNLLPGPDGALYLLDMYRHQIESVHVPQDVWQRIDLTLGRDRGRIYRLSQAGFAVPPRPNLQLASSEELVRHLAHANAWWRETAQRLLTERAEPETAPLVAGLLRSSPSTLAKLHALYLLARIGQLGDADLLVALGDPEPRLRQHALALAESRLDRPGLRAALWAALESEHPGLRFQALASLGQLAQVAGQRGAALEALGKAAHWAVDDRWQQAIWLSSTSGLERELLSALVTDEAFTSRPEGVPLLAELARIVGRRRQKVELNQALGDWARLPREVGDSLVERLLRSVDAGLREVGSSLAREMPGLDADPQRWLNAWYRQAQAELQRPGASPAAQQGAVAWLEFGSWNDASGVFQRLLVPTTHPLLLQAVVEAIGRFDRPEAAELLLERWRTLPPAVGQSVAQALLTRPAWTAALVDALENGEVAWSQIPATMRTVLGALNDPALRQRVATLAAAHGAARQAVLDAYRPVLELKGSAVEGRRVYERECQACHQIGTTGYPVGPNLALTRHRTAAELLVHVLDPNRDVLPLYVQYVVGDLRGGVHTGIVVADDAAAITLRRDGGREDTVQRADIETLISTERSLMPEGFEKTISPADMADLLAYLTQLRYDLGTDPGHEEPAASR